MTEREKELETHLALCVGALRALASKDEANQSLANLVASAEDSLFRPHDITEAKQ